MKKTKILATIGPASEGKMKEMLKAGMDSIRINTSHGDIEKYERIIQNCRRIADIPIMVDTRGPELRFLCEKEHAFQKGDKLKIGFEEDFDIWLNQDIRKHMRKDQTVLVDDGMYKFKIKEIKKDHFVMKAQNIGLITDRIKVNIPEAELHLDILTEVDKKVLKELDDYDYVSLSFTRNAKDIKKAREYIGDAGLIAKIENNEGVKNIDEIIDASEGIMVARGDLGVEIKSEKLPIIQKEIISKCNQKGKLVITATQMLESMINSPTPTRAETSDVANAILDGTDVIMLSGETAVGSYPVQAVKEMTKIAEEVESHVRSSIVMESSKSISEAMSKSVYELVNILPIKLVVTLTRSGYTARIISRFRLDVPVIAITDEPEVRRKLSLFYGVTPVILPRFKARERILKSAKLIHERKLAKPKDMVLFTAGVYAQEHKSTNLIEVHRLENLL